MGFCFSGAGDSEVRDAGLIRSTSHNVKHGTAERIDRTRYETRTQVRLHIIDWIEDYYDRPRMCTSIDYFTAVEYEALRVAA